MQHSRRSGFPVAAGLLLAAVLLVFNGSAAAQSGPETMVLITVGGSVGNSNRPPAREDDRTFLGHLDIEFDSGMAFDRAMLEALGMVEIVTTPRHEEEPVSFRGPLVAAILEAAGATGEVVLVTALDGYVAEVTMEEIAAHGPILAIERDGIPLGLGDQGPGRIVFQPADDPEVNERLRSALAAWAVVYIGVQ